MAKPTHTLFHVIEGKDGKDNFWLKIGAANFTVVTARWIARPPKAAFVTRLRSSRSPDQTARQLPEQSTTLWAEPPSTGETRHRGALRKS